MKPLHQRLHLYTEGDDTYIFVPADEGIETQSLTVHRSSGDIVLNRPNTPLPIYAKRSQRTIYGIVGLIALSLSEYIIVITSRELKGRLMGHEIYRATDFDILPLSPNVSARNPLHPVESHLLALVRSHLRGGHFLFAYGWDITRRLQAQWETQEQAAHKALWEMADDRFFWNRFLQTRLIDATSANAKQDLAKFILPIMYGTFDLRPVFLHGRHMQLCLVSRRSRFRAGTRYFRRGIDREGHVANFNETEQLLLVEGPALPGAQRISDDMFATKLSFVQIRGSVPLFWAEVNTLRYKPDLQIMELKETAETMKKHLLEQVTIYGDQYLVNLVNHKGHEGPVKEAYERYINELNLPNVRYEYFDFHNECKHMRWDRISVLIDILKDDLEKAGYFRLDASQPQPLKMQNGIVRTNCMDNLDRTNVVQAALAKHTLTIQLRDLGILPANAGIDDYEGFSKDFREMWANHADLISTAYAGSGALKSDFTRTNKRTRMGLLEDGVKSVLRYIKNNYFDGVRQDAFDLMTGNWVPRKNPAASLFLVTDARPLITRSIPVIASFSLFMICAGLTLPRTSDYSLLYYFLLWFSLLAITLAFMVIHGIDYVAWPRLIPPTDIIYYTGPGFRSGHHGKGLKDNFGLAKRARWLGTPRGRVGADHMELGDMKKRVD
ncbi:putative sacI homology domain containing protein [Lyophyllum shimeji]|uniref:SacI homology domain containing protein n=1 Tax=Lyophyllum shimeji TaxID=47721 RepID=A0A9P3UML9_LYOSH|nr:putative sacI homology domain containing protein [Lyophyllum shimeji]